MKISTLFRKTWVPWVGILIITLGVLTVWKIRSNPTDGVRLTQEQLENAKKQWKEKAPHTYKFDVVVSGVQNANYHIEVKDDKVASMTEGGKPVAEHVLKFWTIEGMFTFLDEELAQAEQPQIGFQTSDKRDVYLAATFDPTYGYASRYLRQVFGRNLTIEWQVKDFLAE